MDDNTKRMQQDAFKRIQEMQNKSKNTTDKNQSEQVSNNEYNNKSAEPHINIDDNKKDIFEIIMEDKERYLILILLLILVGESADTDILLALMYLLI